MAASIIHVVVAIVGEPSRCYRSDSAPLLESIGSVAADRPTALRMLACTAQCHWGLRLVDVPESCGQPGSPGAQRARHSTSPADVEM